jgi:hypothetical protein
MSFSSQQGPTYQSRVVTELRDLDEKIERLSAFVNGDVFQTVEAKERTLLASQLAVMREYADILRDRIACFAI